MSINNRMTFPRAILFAVTMIVLALIFASGMLIQEQSLLPRIAGYVLAVLSVLSLLPLSREWISPSCIELSENAALVKWNNWRVSGNIAAIDFPEKQAKRLVISLSEAKTLIDPVGPLFLLASFILYPPMKLILPAWQAPLYVISKKQLDIMLGMTGGRTLVITFPALVFGKRRIRRVIENTTSGF